MPESLEERVAELERQMAQVRHCPALDPYFDGLERIERAEQQAAEPHPNYPQPQEEPNG